MNTEGLQIEWIAKEEINIIIPLLKLANDCTVETSCTMDYEQRIQEMLDQGYQCVGVYRGEKLIAISGLWILNKHYVGKHVELDNVIVLPEYRNQGIGAQLVDWVLAYAKTIGCIASEINCYIHNEKGTQFWEDMGYQKIGFHMQKIL